MVFSTYQKQSVQLAPPMTVEGGRPLVERLADVHDDDNQYHVDDANALETGTATSSAESNARTCSWQYIWDEVW